MNHQQQPDLTTILRTLAQHTNTNNTNTSTSTSSLQNPTHHQHQHYQQQHHRYHHQQHNPLPNNPTPTQAAPAAPAAPAQDPSLITTYAASLHYTSALLSQNKHLTARIARLIRTQHAHERSWSENRACVPTELQKRVVGRKAVGELLRSLNGGGIVHGDGGTRDGGKDEDEGEDDNDDDDRERRLEEAYREFDGKVYSAWEAMRVDVGRQLREMGIPGFVLRAGLIGEGEGVELRRRVGGLLEDLCKD